MRTRSESIYASTEETFYEQIDQSLSSSSRREKFFSRKLSRIFADFDEADTDDSENNQLGASKLYKIEENPLSLNEMEIIEEEQINSFIQHLNSFHLRESDLFHFTGINFDTFPEDIKLTEQFFIENVIQYDESVSIMILNANGKENIINTGYFDIKNKVVDINSNKKVKIEIFDASAVRELNQILSIYYKLSNAFVLLTKISMIDLVNIKEKIRSIREKNENNVSILLSICKDTNNKETNLEDLKSFALENNIYLTIDESDFFLNKERMSKFAKVILNEKKQRKIKRNNIKNYSVSKIYSEDDVKTM